MAIISKITPPSGNEYDIRASAIPSGEVDSTSTSTVFTATVPGVTELTEGVCVFLRNGVVTSASGFTLDVNGLGAKPCYSNLATGNEGTPTAATRDTTIFNINYTMLFVYTELIYGVTGGAWICYRGYDANTNTIGYQIRTNSSTLPASDKFYRYRLLFTSANGTKWVPANTSTSTDATAKRTTNTRPIDPFGPIVYYGSTTVINAGSNPGVAVIWQQYTFALGYSFNSKGSALTLSYPAPVYLRCAPQADGSAVMEYFTQSLPTTDDGKIYIFLGRAYSATAMELTIDHPVYYHNGTGIRVWTGARIPTKTSDLINDSGFITSADVPEGSVASTTVPKMDGTAAVGTQTAFARGDHVHPTDITRASTATFSTSANGLVPKPSSAATNSYLNSSGTWTTPPNTTYALATTAANGLLSNQMYSLLENNAIGADESSIDGINAVNGYQIHLSLANLHGDDYILEDYATIPSATTATYGVVKPDGTASHYLNGTGGWTAPPNTTYTTATTAANGLMSAADKKKLDACSTVDNNTTYSTFSTSSDGLVPHPASASTASLLNSSGTWTALPSSVSEFTNDAGYITGMTILSYGQSTFQDFLDAYQANKVVYARASTNANPASGSQIRLAFMACVNNATTPSCVEFQYYRSVSTHTSTQQGDQVFVYTLKNTGWTVTTREASVKVVAGSNMVSTYSNNTITLNVNTFSTSANGLVPKPSSASTNSYLNSCGTWTSPSSLPSVSASDNGKVLTVVNGAWAAASLPIYEGGIR